MDQRIVFLAVNASYIHTNLAERCLEAFTRAPGRKWHTVEALANRPLEHTLQEIIDLAPNVIAATLYLFNRDAVLSVLRSCHEQLPNTRLIVGGPELLGDNRALLESEPYITAAIRGEGEIPFRDCLRTLDETDKWREIDGMCMIADGDYVDNGVAEVIESLDEIPFAYSDTMRAPDKPMLPFETSRGCPGRCSFCTSGPVSRVRYLSEVRTSKDLCRLREAGHTSLRLIDRTFNDNPSRCMSLLRLLRTEFHDMQFHVEIDPARLSSDIMDKLRTAPTGMFHVDVGVQSLQPEVLKAIQRYGSTEQQTEGLEKLCALDNVGVHADLIAGLPRQTLDSVYSDLTRLVSLRPAEIQLETLKLLPGTGLREDQASFGIVSAPERPYAVLQTDTMDSDDVHEAEWLSRVVDWFYGPVSLRRVVVLANELVPHFWKDLCQFCMQNRNEWARPPLETRFHMLNDFFSGLSCAGTDPLVHGLGYAWMKKGFSHRNSICSGKPWNRARPTDAVLVEGDESAEVSRIRAATIDRLYLFCYGTKGASHGAVAVYHLP